MSARRWLAAVACLLATLAPEAARAFGLDPSSFTNPEKLLESAVVDPVITSIGVLADHKAYQPATPLGPSGFDLEVQVVATKLPDSFNQALVQAGSSKLDIPFVPLPRVIMHKGIGNWLDLGLSYVQYQQQKIYGGDAKLVVWNPDEGPTLALRMSYAQGAFEFSTSEAELAINTRTYKPEIVVSRKLDFADPYIGIGYEIVRGSVDIGIPVPIPIPGFPSEITGSADGKGQGALAFIGVGLRVPGIGLKLTIDEEYSALGAHSLGMALGFQF